VSLGSVDPEPTEQSTIITARYYTMQCFVYLRTSSADTDVKAGIPVQRAACEAYTLRSGLTVLGEVADDVSLARFTCRRGRKESSCWQAYWPMVSSAF
jgi:hypothetical protein